MKIGKLRVSKADVNPSKQVVVQKLYEEYRTLSASYKAAKKSFEASYETEFTRIGKRLHELVPHFFAPYSKARIEDGMDLRRTYSSLSDPLFSRLEFVQDDLYVSFINMVDGERQDY